ncbi:MAG: phosphate ABC transporter permease PstA [Actinobacteria bacterium]|nr:phosphate ABC transporter permease PstA [Actinomycetota bacterium]MBV8562702.1 phosphate ABC transporter permease PstA [Actinomycetota bacterium]
MSAQPSALMARSHGLRRRRAVNRGMEWMAWLAALIAVAILGVVVWSVARRGASELNLNLLTKSPVPFAPPNVTQGLANAFAGTLVIVGLATAMALPIGILVALYLNEFAPPSIKNGVSLTLDVLNGIPAVVIGIFVFGLLVVGHGQSGMAGAFALAVLMLPLVSRSTMEVLALVPNSLREASLGLGVPRWRTTLSIVLPQTLGGIVTGTVLAVARVAGETAPLLFTSSIVANATSWNPGHALQTVPVAIFELSESPDPADHARAWAAALVLLLFIMFASLGARWLATRTRRKLGAAR